MRCVCLEKAMPMVQPRASADSNMKSTSTPDVFDVSEDSLQRLNLTWGNGTREDNTTNNRRCITNPASSKRITCFGRGQHTQEQQIKEFVHKNTLLKFALMCRKLNIDPMSQYSIQAILMIFGKIKEKKMLLDHFCEVVPDTGIHVDWEKIYDGSGKFDLSIRDDADNDSLGEHAQVHNLFYAMTDWIIMINYLEIQTGNTHEENLQRDRNMQRMTQSLMHAGLNQHFDITTALAAKCLLYIMPGTLSGSKMLERLFVSMMREDEQHCRDLEFKCLRALSHFNDMQVDEEASMLTTIALMTCMHIKPVFFTDMQTVLQMEDELTKKNIDIPTNTRLRLRDVVNTIHTDAPQFAETYDHWVTQQKFTTAMSKHLQLLLYFITVQVEPVPAHAYDKHFNDATLHAINTRANLHVQQIDPSAVIRIIKSIRVYLHNVHDLLDFRTQCLNGINKSKRLALNLAQVLQLYVAAYQHESIRERCWKSVVNIWNHTIETDIARFRDTHAFDVVPVVEAIVHCQLGHFLTA